MVKFIWALIGYKKLNKVILISLTQVQLISTFIFIN